MKLLTSFVVKFCSLCSQSEVKFTPNYYSLAPRVAQTSLPIGNFTFVRKLHLPARANLVVEPTCETHDGLDVGHKTKRFQNRSKTGVVKAKSLKTIGGKKYLSMICGST